MAPAGEFVPGVAGLGQHEAANQKVMPTTQMNDSSTTGRMIRNPRRTIVCPV
jgi:hypothetical protein